MKRRYDERVGACAAADAGACLRAARAGRFAENGGHAIAHLAGGFVREGQRDDCPRGNAALDQTRNAVGDDPRLAGPRPREHEERPLSVFHSFALCAVQTHLCSRRHKVMRSLARARRLFALFVPCVVAAACGGSPTAPQAPASPGSPLSAPAPPPPPDLSPVAPPPGLVVSGTPRAARRVVGDGARLDKASDAAVRAGHRDHRGRGATSERSSISTNRSTLRWRSPAWGRV